jgi:hypothetical protein
MIWREFECETSLIAKTPEETRFPVVRRTYQIFERMASFFSLFFFLAVLLVTSSPKAFGADPPLAGGTRCPQCVGKANAALPPKFDFAQRFAGNTSRKSCAFGD